MVSTEREREMSKRSDAEREEARELLRGWMPPGSTVYTVLRHVSASGMSRDIDAYAQVDGEITWISGYAAAAAGFSRGRGRHDGAIRMGGCGMDMGFQLVYQLSSVLYGRGSGRERFECIGEGAKWADHCPSNDHSNGDRDYTPHLHSDGAYAIRQRWL